MHEEVHTRHSSNTRSPAVTTAERCTIHEAQRIGSRKSRTLNTVNHLSGATRRCHLRRKLGGADISGVQGQQGVLKLRFSDQASTVLRRLLFVRVLKLAPHGRIALNTTPHTPRARSCANFRAPLGRRQSRKLREP